MYAVFKAHPPHEGQVGVCHVQCIIPRALRSELSNKRCSRKRIYTYYTWFPTEGQFASWNDGKLTIKEGVSQTKQRTQGQKEELVPGIQWWLSLNFVLTQLWWHMVQRKRPYTWTQRATSLNTICWTKTTQEAHFPCSSRSNVTSPASGMAHLPM